jgi:hypothetical protein
MAAADADAAEKALLAAVDRDGEVDSAALAATLGWEHLRLVGTIKSLESFELITTQARRARARAGRGSRRPRAGALRHPGLALTPHTHVRAQVVDHARWVLTEESRGYLQAGTPEAQVFQALPAGEEGVTLADLKARASERQPRTTTRTLRHSRRRLRLTARAAACVRARSTAARGARGGGRGLQAGDDAEARAAGERGGAARAPHGAWRGRAAAAGARAPAACRGLTFSPPLRARV